MKEVLEVVGISKQGFHQMLERRHLREEEWQQLIPVLRDFRKDHPRMSARDIYLRLQPSAMGRDRFERLCLESGFRVKPLKNYRVTTNSFGVTRFPNLIKDKKLTGINQVFVSDITYYEIGSKCYYITLIMDLFNREIVGWSASDNLRTEWTTIPALHQLFRVRGKSNIQGAIFHSDGGGQYYCKEFLALTKGLMLNSMTEEKVYENSHAERLNGTIKNNYLYPYNPKNLASLRKMLNKAVYMYNTGKPHCALGKLTPSSFLLQNTVDYENNSKKSYFPLPTVYHIHTSNINFINKKVNDI
jgi:transposase InsO family protein